MIFEQEYKDVLQIKLFQYRNKVSKITQENGYQEKIIIKHNGTDKKPQLIIPSNQGLTSSV